MKLSKIKIWKKSSFLLAFLGSVFLFQTASALEYGSLGGTPAFPDPNIENSSSWFVYALSPGEKKEDGVVVINTFDGDLDVSVYGADSTPSSSGGFALKQFTEEKTEVGSWIKFYPESVPDFFKETFQKKDNKIIELCKMNREQLQSEKEDSKVAILNEEFAKLEQWCAGVDGVSLKMKSKERHLIPFVISIPADAEVGEHTGGILIQKVSVEDVQAGGGSAVKLTTRVGVRVYETVPGEIIKKLFLNDFVAIKNFKEFDYSQWFAKVKKSQEYLLQMKIRNEGNVSVGHQNIIHIKDLLFDKKSQEISDRNFQVLKHDTFISNFSWENPRFGKFALSEEIKYQDASGNEQVLKSDTINLWIIPWKEIVFAIFLLAIIAIGYVLYSWYQKKRYGGIGWVEYKVKKDENVATIAEKFKLNWKVFVKTNKLKAPYLLATGQIVLVPGGKEDAGKKIDDVQKKVSTKVKSATKNKKVAILIDEPATKKTKIEKKTDVASRKMKQGTKNNLAIWILSGIVIVLVILVGVLLFSQRERAISESKISISALSGQDAVSIENVKQSTLEEKKNESVTIAEESKKEITKKDVSVAVLNGGGAPGQAGKLKNMLAVEGFEKVVAKNAENTAYTGTVVYYGSEFKSIAETLNEIIVKSFPKSEIREANNDETKSADIVVILGR